MKAEALCTARLGAHKCTKPADHPDPDHHSDRGDFWWMDSAPGATTGKGSPAKTLDFPAPTERQLVIATHALKAILSEPEKAKALSMEALTRIRQISEDQMETP